MLLKVHPVPQTGFFLFSAKGFNWKVGFAIPLSPFPCIPRKAPFREKRFITKGLGLDSKASDSHCANPAEIRRNAPFPSTP